MAKSTSNSEMSALTINELLPRLKRCLKVKQPAFLWAGPGIGKSSVVKTLAQKLNGIAIDMRLSQMSPTDIMGIPYYNKAKETMSWAPPSLLPSAELAAKYEIVILFLDELNSAPPSVQAAAYQLVLDRRTNEYVLPDNVVIVAAGNRETDRGVTFRMASPLANRFVHFDLKVDFESWFDWAVNAKINSDVVSFIATYKNKLNNFDPTLPDKAFATPRSWEFVSNLISVDEDEQELSDGEKRDLIGAAVGSGMSTEFMAHLKIGKDLPSPAKVLSGEITELRTRELSAHYQIIIALCYELREFYHANSKAKNSNEPDKRDWNSDKALVDFSRQFDNFLTFVSTQMSTEVTIMALRLACKNYRLASNPTKLKMFSTIVSKYGKYIIDSGE